MPKLEMAKGEAILKNWQLFRRFPGGSWLFSKILGLVVPYSGSIDSRIVELERGSATVFLNDTRKVRNHLNSIHAIALANLCELASGLALMTALPSDARAILTEFSLSYFKKARGTIVAKSKTASVSSSLNCDVVIDVQAFDAAGELVASARATWRVGPKK